MSNIDAALMTSPLIREGISQLNGSELVKSNILIAKIIRAILQKSLGPSGSKKFLVDSLKYFIISCDGATILKRMSIWHPVAKILIHLATAQKDTTGDGSISSVVLASEFLERAERLLDDKIHPSIIIHGYKEALKKALRILDEIAVEIESADRKILKKVVYTIMSTKLGAKASLVLTDIVLDVIERIKEKRDNNWIANIDLVHIVKKPGKTVNDSIFVRGMVMDEQLIHPQMPKHVKNPKIAVLTHPLEIEKLEHHPPTVQGKIEINNPELIKPFIDKKAQILKDWVNKIKAAGANVVFCEKRIDDLAAYFLARAGIMAVTLYRWAAKQKFILRVAKACNANIVRDLDDLKEEDLGSANLVEERKVGDNKIVVIEGCKTPQSVCILIRGISKEIMEDVEKTVLDVLYATANLFKCNKIVAGGGAVEVELKKRLTEFSREFHGKEQFAVKAFADALLCIPRALVTNTGLNSLDILPFLIAEHQQSANMWYGYNALGKKIDNMMNAGIIMPLAVTKAIFKGACETAISILRIDDMLNLKKEKKEEIPPDAIGRQLPGFLSASHLPQYKDHEKKYTVF
ncbi:thermosome subunit beta [Candidatus Borrarchaeum sp.]|uniref:thermosome subunit beta n=1 Tax=Candidatus Borrarchaeum sp. TaxID=2846742 RepID=UPI0025798C3D|nr:thermosome subunit beta [Candidatus Borrarchaeum sp.]